jgi:parallel beta-helix repeat protein
MNKKRMVATWMALGFVLSAIVMIVDVSQPVLGVTITVDDSGGADFEKIQDAINASSDGTTVFVYSGTYFENVVVNRSINLTGEGRESTIIDANATGYALYVSANHTNITGFTARNSPAGGFGGIMLFNVTNCSVYNNTASDNQIGIRTHSSMDCDIFENNASGNDIGMNIEISSNIEIRDNQLASNEYGVYGLSSENINIINNTLQLNNASGIFFASSNVSISNNDFTSNYYGIRVELSQKSDIIQNSVQSSGKCGIYLKSSSNSNIENNDVVSNNEYGIFLESSSGSDIKDNYVFNNYFGIALNVSSGNTLDNNEVLDDFDGIYLLFSDSNIISNNSVNLSGESAISLIFSSSNTISDNFVALSDFYGFYLNVSSDNDIFHNTINENFFQAYDDGSTNNWDSGYPGGGNFWWDYMGFDNFSGVRQDIPGGDGLGDTSYEIDTDSHDNYPLMEPTLDTLAPRIRLLAPDNNSFVTSGVDLDFYVNDGNLDYAEYSTDGSSWDLLPFPYEVSSTGWNEGLQTVLIRAQDTNGNLAQKSFHFQVDVTKPEITLQNPANNTIFKRGTQIDLAISDVNPFHVNFSLDGGNLTSLPSPYDVDTVNWPDGEHILLIEAVDEATNIQSRQYIFTIDSSHPHITQMGVMIYPREGDGGANVSLNVTDPSGVQGVWMEITDPNGVYIDNFSAQYDPDTSKYYLNESFTVVGTYQVLILASDTIGNWISASETFQVVILATEPWQLSSRSGDSFVHLTWLPPNSTGGLPLIGYRIYRSVFGAEGYETFDIGNQTEYNDTAVANDFTYNYQVVALTDAGEGPPSNEEAAKPSSGTQGGRDPTKPKGFPDWLLWLILIIIALFVILLLVMLKKRSKDDTEPPQRSPPKEER